uniref:F-box domain-containing protein n=1 Tax=Oryza punctata TaxID=4537 RepID=A0A0E0MPG0_ORYPU
MDTGEEAAAARWGDMDADCLVEIFRRLPLDDVAAAAPLVCRSWRAAGRDALLWRELDLRGGGGATARFMPWSPLGAAFAARYGVRRFSFAGYLRLCVARAAGHAVELTLPPLLGAPELDLVSLRCPALRKVSLPSLSAADDARLPDLVARWRRLEHLELEHRPASFPATAARVGASCPGFSSLKMAGAIREVDAAAMATSLPRLKHLCLDGCYLPRHELLAVIHGCLELESLSAKLCVGFDEGDDEVAREAAMIERFEVGGSRLVDKFDQRDVDGLDDDTSSYVDVM